MKRSVPAGSTGVVEDIFVADPATGVGLAALAPGTSGLAAYFKRKGSAAVSFALVVGEAGEHTSSDPEEPGAGGGIVPIQNLRGGFELSLPDAALAGGASSVLFWFNLPSGVSTEPFEIGLTPAPGVEGAALRTVRLRFRDGASAPIPGAQYQIAFVGVGVAGLDGDAEIALHDGTYTIRVSPIQGVLFPPTEIEVGEETTEFTLAGARPATPDPSPLADECVLYVELEQWTGVEIGSVEIKALPSQLPNHRWLVGRSFTATVDGAGRITFPPVPRRATVEIAIPAARLTKTLVVPNQATHRF